MANTPTIKEIRDSIVTNIEGALPQVQPIRDKSVLDIVAWSVAGVASLIYKTINFFYLQVFPDTAEGTNLDKWGDTFNITRSPASQSSLKIKVIGQDGTIIPLGTQLTYDLTGIIYNLTEEITLTSGEGEGVVTAATFGSIGNVSNGFNLRFLNVEPTYSENAEVLETTRFGVDEESDADFQVRILARLTNPPQGGAFADYRAWSLEVATIIGAYPFSDRFNPGLAHIYIESSVGVDGVASALEITQVIASINTGGRKPVTDELDVASIGRSSVNVQIINLVPDNSTNRGIIQDTLERYALERAPFIEALDEFDLGIIKRGDMLGEINIAFTGTGAVIDDLSFDVDFFDGGNSTTISNYRLRDFEKVKLGNLTYVT